MLTPKSNEVKQFLIKNRKYAKKAILRNYPFTLNELKNYDKYLNWDEISCNEQIKWDAEVLHAFEKKLNWTFVSTNKEVFKNPDLIEEFIDQIHWYEPHLSMSTIANNKGVNWTDEMINKYEHLLDFEQLGSNNESVSWSEELIDRYIDRWYWNDIAGIYKLPWSVSFFEKYRNRLNINSFFFQTNPTLTSDLDFIDKYGHLLEPWAIFENDKLPWREKNLLKKWEDKIDWYGVAGNKLLLSDSNFFYDNIHRWIHSVPEAFHMLSQNTGVPWSIELIEKYKSYWDWKLLSQNEGLPWSAELIEYFKDELLWGEVIVHNEYFTENGEPIKEHEFIFEDAQRYMTSNPALPWSFEFIQYFENEIDTETLSTNYKIWQKVFEPYVTPDMLNDIITNYWSLKYLASTDN